MVARGSEDYELIGNTDDLGLGYTAYANRDNFEYGGYAGGADDARQNMYNMYQSAQGRSGPVTNYTQADADLASAMNASGKQNVQLGTLFGQMYGVATPQQQQLQASTTQAMGAQRSLANSGRGFGAISMAGQLGDQRAAQLQMQGDQQLAMQQAQDRATARDMFGNLSNQVYGQDLATRGALQQRAINDAGLQDQQRAQNDAMARYYLGERYKIGQAQLGANMAYEAQDASNRLGYSNLNAQQAERAAQRQEATQNAALQGASQGASFLGSQISSSKQEPDNSGIIRKNPY